MKKLLSISFLLLLAALISCNSGSNEAEDEVIAEVYGEQLTESTMMQDLSGKMSSGDSSKIIEDYVRNWVRSAILFSEAEETLSESEKDKEELLRQYYRDLIVHEFREKLLAKHLDLNVDEAEILKYFEEHKENFELKENIVKLLFFKLSNKTARLNQLWYKFNTGTKANLDEITYAAVQGGGNFNRDEDIWLSFNDIIKEIPITTYNQEGYLSNHKLIKVSDKEFTYFVKILDFRIKNNISPLERESERIRRIIQNRRKSDLLKQLENQIVEEAYQSQKVKIN